MSRPCPLSFYLILRNLSHPRIQSYLCPHAHPLGDIESSPWATPLSFRASRLFRTCARDDLSFGETLS